MSRVRILLSFDFLADGDALGAVRALTDKVAENVGGSVVRRSVDYEAQYAEAVVSACPVAARWLALSHTQFAGAALAGCGRIEEELRLVGLSFERLVGEALLRELEGEVPELW